MITEILESAGYLVTTHSYPDNIALQSCHLIITDYPEFTSDRPTLHTHFRAKTESEKLLKPFSRDELLDKITLLLSS